jgi:hypothetical protein
VHAGGAGHASSNSTGVRIAGSSNATSARGGQGKSKEGSTKHKGWAWEAYEKRQAELKKQREDAQLRRDKVGDE